MPASMLYQLFKEKTKHPLHTAIKAKREDVVFLYFIEHDADLVEKVNELDDKNDLPLDLALRSRQESIAKSLINHRVDLNRVDSNGLSLLHKAIKRDDFYSASFLVENNINVNIQSNREDRLRTVLMYLASHPSLSDDMINLVKQILESKQGYDVNVQDSEGNTVLHIAISSKNKTVFKEILFNKNSRPNLNIKNKEEQTVLWLALLESEELNDFQDDLTFPNLLIQQGCEINTIDSNGDSLLHLCARKCLENAALFLVNKQANINNQNTEVNCIFYLRNM
jgi:ankyrin repeat protein